MLIEKLKDKQAGLGLSDARFAMMLGIPRSTWRHAKVGLRRPGRKLVLGAMRSFPDMAAECVSFFLNDGTSDAKIDTTVAH